MAARLIKLVTVIMLLALGCKHYERHSTSPSRTAAAPVTPSRADKHVVEAQSFVVVDMDGVRRGEFFWDEAKQAAQLTLAAADGTPLVNVAGDDRAPSLTLYNRSKGVRVIVDSTSVRIVDERDLDLARLVYETRGSAQSCTISVQTREGAPFVSISALLDGPPMLMMAGTDGQGSASLTIEDGSPRFELRDAQGRTIVNSTD